MPPLPSSTAIQSQCATGKYRRRSVQAARAWSARSKRLHDELGLLLGQGDGLTHWAQSPAVVQRRAMLGSQESRR
jgi:hypothetical protein